MNPNMTQSPLLKNQIDPFNPPQYNVSPQNDVRASNSYAADLNPLNEKKQSYHVKSLISCIILWVAVPIIIILTVVKKIDLTPGAVGGICAGIYAFYLLLSMCCNPLFNYLSNIQHGQKFNEEYNRVQGLVGHFVFRVQCYHYETRYHTRTVTDSNGNRRTQTYTTTQKVVTHRNSQSLYPIKTIDDSGSVDRVRALTLVVFIHYIVNYRFTDELSRQNFDYEWYRFKANNTFDVHQDFNYIYTVPGLIERMSFFIGQKKPNWFGFLIFWSLVGMIWPFSRWVQSKTSRYDIKFLKILTVTSSYKY